MSTTQPYQHASTEMYYMRANAFVHKCVLFLGSITGGVRLYKAKTAACQPT